MSVAVVSVVNKDLTLKAKAKDNNTGSCPPLSGWASLNIGLHVHWTAVSFGTAVQTVTDSVLPPSECQ